MSSTLVEGKGGTFYPPFPVLAVASDDKDLFLLGGGGGSKSTKEVPNLVQAFKYDEATGGVRTVASINSGASTAVYISHAKALDLWLASCGTGCKMLSLTLENNSLTEVAAFETEEPGKFAAQNVVLCSPSGDMIATGGTEGSVRFWKVEEGKQKEAPVLAHKCAVHKEVLDLSWSRDGKVLASADRTGCCRLWDPSNGDETSSIKFKAPLNVRAVRYFTAPDGKEQLVMAGCGPRGPAVLGTFSVDGTKLKEVTVDKLPLSSIAVDASGSHVVVCLCSGEKHIYSLPDLRRSTRLKAAHDLPAPGCAFVGEATAVSGSGDRSINLLVARKSGSNTSFLLYIVLFLAAILVYFISQFAAPGAIPFGGGEL
eukprot:TRINITY_DN44017_c0_g1_i1.p1 TRINITY_DN44017_c0_g1~~TRINITY_DN44017_c0_g1_i1.p1  ORF type:complete len:370 (-),score=73.39 TRINITY_DN44017_c0_g1_i1:75-1184(-)